MAIDQRKRQKQLARKAGKRKSKQRQMARQSSGGLPARLAAAAHCPVLHCWVTNDMWSHGIGWLCLSRQLPNGSVAFAVFLVDRYCLGVKNAMGDVIPRATYDSKVTRDMRSQYETEDMDPAAARKLIEGAVAYAASFGLHASEDYHAAKRLFGDIDAGQCMESFEFGKDGKPCFIAGPHDTPPRCRQIMAALQHYCGEGNYHFTMPVGGAEGLPPGLSSESMGMLGNDEEDFIEELDESSRGAR